MRSPARSFSEASRNWATTLGVETPKELAHLGGGRMEERRWALLHLLGTVMRMMRQDGGRTRYPEEVPGVPHVSDFKRLRERRYVSLVQARAANGILEGVRFAPRHLPSGIRAHETYDFYVGRASPGGTDSSQRREDVLTGSHQGDGGLPSAPPGRPDPRACWIGTMGRRSRRDESGRAARTAHARGAEPLLDWKDLEREIAERRGWSQRAGSLKVTFVDAGVLIFAARGAHRSSLAALAILDDPERSFASSVGLHYRPHDSRPRVLSPAIGPS